MPLAGLPLSIARSGPVAIALLALVACDPQGDCSHSYATPSATFTCRGGTYSVTCVGADPARQASPPYTCTCTAPDGATSSFSLDREMWSYESGGTDFSSGYAVVNERCHWHLSD